MSLASEAEAMGLEETQQVGRMLLSFLNTFPGIPNDIAEGAILYEQLQAKTVCMSMSTIQGTYITDWDIVGRREAEYQFKIVYRIRPGNSVDKRLTADEVLDAFGEWVNGQTPDIGAGKTVLELRPATKSAVVDANAQGDEDHQILFLMRYQIGADGATS